MEIKELHEIITLKSGKKPSPLHLFIKENGIPWVKISDIKNHSLSKTKQYFDPHHLHLTKYIKENSMLITLEGTTGIVFKNSIDCCIDNHIAEIIFLKNIINKDYLFYWFIKKKNTLKRLERGTVLKSISKNDIYKIKINIPCLTDQQAIINIIEPKEKLFLKFHNLVRIENFDIFKNDWDNLINIIEPFDKLLEFIESKIEFYKKLSKNIYHILSTKLMEKFVNENKIVNQKFNNQKLYVETSSVLEGILEKWEEIYDRKSRANLSVSNNSIVFSKMKGYNKLLPIFEPFFNQFVYSTGFINIKSNYPLYTFGWMLTEEFIKLKNSTSQGTLMEGVNNKIVSTWEIPIMNKKIWDDKLNNILIVINKLNIIKIILKKIINNLIHLLIN